MKMHHQRAPRTPESYFNVPESIALLNIVKSERIQSAFQSNRKNHASVWEMVANILNRYSQRKRSAKQCCNRYENLKKIYTQLKRNPQKHVRRNWPYMYLFREIEEQRGESWGSSGKRAAANLLASAAASGENVDHPSEIDLSILGATNRVNNNAFNTVPTNESAINLKNEINNELSFYQKRKNVAALTSMLLNREVMLTNINSNNNQIINNDMSNSDRHIMPNNFVETELKLSDDDDDINECDDDEDTSDQGKYDQGNIGIDLSAFGLDNPHINRNNIFTNANGNKRSNQEFGLPDFLCNIKGEPVSSDQESVQENKTNTTNTKRIVVLPENKYHGRHPFINGHPNNSNTDNNNNNNNNNHHPVNTNNLAHQTNNTRNTTINPDVIVDTQSDSSGSERGGNAATGTNKRKLSTTSDDGESTNYELIEYLRRREKRDALMFKQMNEREERLINLLERTVLAIEKIAEKCCEKSCQIKNETTSKHGCSGNNNHNVTKEDSVSNKDKKTQE